MTEESYIDPETAGNDIVQFMNRLNLRFIRDFNIRSLLFQIRKSSQCSIPLLYPLLISS